MSDCYSLLMYQSSGMVSDKARDRRRDRVVALKKVKMDREQDGFPLTALRELKVCAAA